MLVVIFFGPSDLDSRMIPFILIKYKGLPAIVERFLKFLPVSIIFSLILSSVVTGKVGSLPQIKWLDFFSSLSNGLVAFRYRNLVGTVLFWSGLDCSLASGLLVSHKKTYHRDRYHIMAKKNIFC